MLLSMVVIGLGYCVYEWSFRAGAGGKVLSCGIHFLVQPQIQSVVCD